jgi:hypothetical protein
MRIDAYASYSFFSKLIRKDEDVVRQLHIRKGHNNRPQIAPNSQKLARPWQIRVSNKNITFA